MNLPDVNKLTMTQGVLSLCKIDDGDASYLYTPALANTVRKNYEEQVDAIFDGSNDKSFFSFEFRGVKLFAAANEVNGLTIMLPEEY